MNDSRINYVYQNLFGEGEGNCFPACLASILKIPLDYVPHFCRDNGEFWLDDCRVWLKKYFGLTILLLPITDDPREWRIPEAITPSPGTLCILSGESSRGIQHSIVAEMVGPERGEIKEIGVVYKNRGFRYIHDPFKGGDGIAKITDVMYLIDMTPSSQSCRAQLLDLPRAVS
jgi:hypothetical protein